MNAISSAILAMLAMSVGIALGGTAIALCVIWLAWAAVAKWAPKSGLGPVADFPLGSVGLVMLLLALPGGCAWTMLSSEPQPASNQAVAAVEVPLRTRADHAELLVILRRHARDKRMHVDDGTEQWKQFRQNSRANEPESARNILDKTIYAGVWRGDDDNDSVMDVDDGGHQGRAWLTFFKGKQPAINAQFRSEVLAGVRQRWPDVRAIPIMGNGALPLSEDLVWTGKAYVVRADRRSAYAEGVNLADRSMPPGNDPRK